MKDHSTITPKTPLTMLRDVTHSEDILNSEATAMIDALQDQFSLRRHALLMARTRRIERFRRGEGMQYNPETEALRRGIWHGNTPPENLSDRRVELIAPADNLAPAFASTAPIIIADFEDTASPSFGRLIKGQAALKSYQGDAVLLMRPRALDSVEENVLAGGTPIAAPFFDLGLYLSHNATRLADANQGPFIYIPKIDSADEARLWADMLGFAEDRLGLARGTIKVTAMIERINAALNMDEIVDALKAHIIGMSFGADDLIVDYLRIFEADTAACLPDRSALQSDTAFLATIAARLVKVCHRRGIHAIGGMYAGTDAAGINAAMQPRIADGHDGAWVMDPAQVEAALAYWHDALPGANQIRTPRQDYRIDPQAMTQAHKGQPSEAGMQDNIALAMEYLSGWLRGHGRVEYRGQVLDMATAEIARRLLRQWVVQGAKLTSDAGEYMLDEARFGAALQAQIGNLIERHGAGDFHRAHYASAARILSQAVLQDTPCLAALASPVMQALDD